MWFGREMLDFGLLRWLVFIFLCFVFSFAHLVLFKIYTFCLPTKKITKKMFQIREKGQLKKKMSRKNVIVM